MSVNNLLQGLLGINSGTAQGSSQNQQAQGVSAGQRQHNSGAQNMGQGLNHQQWQQQQQRQWQNILDHQQYNNQVGQIMTYNGQKPQWILTPEAIAAQKQLFIEKWLKETPENRELYLNTLKVARVVERLYGSNPYSLGGSVHPGLASLEEMETAHTTAVFEKEILE